LRHEGGLRGRVAGDAAHPDATSTIARLQRAGTGADRTHARTLMRAMHFSSSCCFCTQPKRKPRHAFRHLRRMAESSSHMRCWKRALLWLMASCTCRTQEHTTAWSPRRGSHMHACQHACGTNLDTSIPDTFVTCLSLLLHGHKQEPQAFDGWSARARACPAPASIKIQAGQGKRQVCSSSNRPWSRNSFINDSCRRCAPPATDHGLEIVSSMAVAGGVLLR